MRATTVKTDDLIQSIADGLQYISCYHSRDFIEAMNAAYDNEQSKPAKDALAQVLENSRMCALGRRPVCQDTGIVAAFVDIGMDVRWSDTGRSLAELVNAGVRRAYLDPDNPLRASIVSDPAGRRVNTKDNTPAVVHVTLVPGSTVRVSLMAKGGGSENRARFAMLNPSDDIADWVVDTVSALGAGWCPPGVLGIGIGGTADKAMLLAKESLLEPIDIHELLAAGPECAMDELRIELYRHLNMLGIGAQGLGGLTTVLDVKIRDFPTHAASKPVALIPNCAANRVVRFELDGSGAAAFEPPDEEMWKRVTPVAAGDAVRVNLDTLTRDEVSKWRIGDCLLLSGSLLTARDAAHKRLVDLLASGEALPGGLNFDNRFVYYVGPVEKTADEIIGPAGPTTASRMDRFLPAMFEHTGLLGSIGKAERSPDAVAEISRHGAVYLIAVGGAAYLISRSIRRARTVAFPDLGMESIREFVVEDMPVTVAVDTSGASIHEEGPGQWGERAIKFHRR